MRILRGINYIIENQQKTIVIIIVAFFIVTAFFTFRSEYKKNKQTVSTPTASPVFSATPSPSFEPTVKGSATEKPTPKVVNDPIVNCTFSHSGGISMLKSKCDKMTDCEISDGKWSAVYTTDCDKLHEEQKKEIKTVSTSTPSPILKEKTIKCLFDDSWGKSHDFGMVTKDYCDQMMGIWTSYKPSTYTPYSFQPYVPTIYTPIPTTKPDYSQQNLVCKNNARYSYQTTTHNIQVQMGGDSSAYYYALQLAQDNLSQVLKNCDYLYPVS